MKAIIEILLILWCVVGLIFTLRSDIDNWLSGSSKKQGVFILITMGPLSWALILAFLLFGGCVIGIEWIGENVNRGMMKVFKWIYNKLA